MAVPIAWLDALNREFRDLGVAQRLRPFEALSRYSKEFRINFSFDSQIAKEIFAYFEARSKPGAHNIGHQYESVFYFDAEFWTVSIPLVFGEVRLDIYDSLIEMPNSLKSALLYDQATALDYSLFWADCVDYGLGFPELLNSSNLDQFTHDLLLAGDKELRAAVSQLKENRPDSRAIMSCRLALEIFLKAYISLKVGLTENAAKNLSHNLERSFNRFIEVSGYDSLDCVKDKLNVYPKHSDRYKDVALPRNKLWQGFEFAQSIAVLIVRENTGWNTTAQVTSARD